MSKIRVRNFGPIREGCQENDGWIDIKKVTVFIGNQGSGKSTLAKLISTFTWMEKALVRGDFDKKWFERKNKLKNQFLNYHRLENYFNTDSNDYTTLEYDGDAFSIKLEKDSLIIIEKQYTSYPLPQIMYVPAERNFVSYVRTPKELKLSSESLKEFLVEFDNAKNELKGIVKLPINDVDVEYDKLNDTLNLKGNGYKVKLTEASSGFQSLVPLYLVSAYLAESVKRQSEINKEPMSIEEMERFKKGVSDILNNDNLTDEQKKLAISVLSSKFNKTAFLNIVEEPEQNLFPSSQWQILQSLLEFNNINVGNKLILTTHSPYIIGYLGIAVQGCEVKLKILEGGKGNSLISKLNEIVSDKSVFPAENLVVYELDEIKGIITRLPSPEGIPSGNNFLNNSIKESNQLFDSLLDIIEEI